MCSRTSLWRDLRLSTAGVHHGLQSQDFRLQFVMGDVQNAAFYETAFPYQRWKFHISKTKTVGQVSRLPLSALSPFSDCCFPKKKKKVDNPDLWRLRDHCQIKRACNVQDPVHPTLNSYEEEKYFLRMKFLTVISLILKKQMRSNGYQ